VEGPAVFSTSHRVRLEAAPSPLSSRAKPRDLQFYRPVLEMFFEKVLMQVEEKLCRPYGARTMLGIDAPALPGLG
jgi:hypothetical protein